MSVTSSTETSVGDSALPATFIPADIEGPLYQRWVDRGYFQPDPKSDKPPFCIVIPPPNVTGSLHIGHALDHTIQDATARRRNRHSERGRAAVARAGPYPARPRP